MKKRCKILSFIILSFIIFLSHAFIVAGQDIANCQTISSPGYYTLTQDVSLSGTCFTVNVDDVIIDCAGHTITYSIGGGADTRGVYSWKSNTTVKNCNIIDGNPGSTNSNRIGIYYASAFNGTIQDNYIEGGSRGAIYLSNHDYGTIKNNNVTCRNGAGIMLTGNSDYYNITNNTARAQGSFWTASGIVIYTDGDDNILLDNTATSESYTGILITDSSTRNVLIGNNGTSFNGPGIQLSTNANHNVLIDNTGTGNGDVWNAAGILLWSNSINNTLIDNTGIGTGTKLGGLYMYRNASNSKLIGNTFITERNEPAVAHLHTSSSNNIIKNNTFISESGDGRLLIIGESSMNNTVYYNYFTETTGLYIGNSHSNNDTQYNTTVGGKPRGNYYFNITSINIIDSDGDGWGDSGSDYPLNETNWPAKWWLSLADWGPATTPPPIPGEEEMPEILLPFFNTIHFFITLIIIGIVYLLMISRKTK